MHKICGCVCVCHLSTLVNVEELGSCSHSWVTPDAPKTHNDLLVMKGQGSFVRPGATASCERVVAEARGRKDVGGGMGPTACTARTSGSV